jgi:beta-mannosidase
MDGTTRQIAEVKMPLPSDAAVEVLRLPRTALGSDEVLAFTWAGDASGGDVFAPKPWKAYDLLNPHLTYTVVQRDGGQEITITSQTLAPFVAVEADIPGRFSANAFALFPGHPATLTFTPQSPGAVANFTLRSLYSATYGAV